jgi:hypothetical protein
MKGRPPKHQPTLAFERRRYLTLVQVLALPDGEAHAGIKELCRVWEVTPITQGNTIQYWATVRELAQHVVEYHREQE